MARPARLRGRQDPGQKLFQRARRERPDRPVGLGVVLDAETGVEEAQVLGHLRDGGHRRLEGAAGDALLDRHRGRDAGQAVEVGSGHLLDELAGVRRHRFHEPALALGEDDVEGQGRFSGAGDARDHGQLAVRDGDRKVLQVVLAGAHDHDRGAVGGRAPAGAPGVPPWAPARARGRRRLASAARRKGEVATSRPRAIASGVPSATIRPPPAPASGPTSRIQSARLEHVEIVLDHHQAVPALDQRLQHLEQTADVMAVEPGRRLVQQEQRCRPRPSSAPR